MPTLDDNDYVLWDGNAICIYLIEKYANNDRLYPKDLQLRSTINQRLFFNASHLFTLIKDCFLSILFKGQPTYTDAQIEKVRQAYNLLNELFRDGNAYLVEDTLSVADLCMAPSISQLELVLPIDGELYPNIRCWLKRMISLPYYEELNAKIVDELRQIMKEAMEKNRSASVAENDV